MASEGSKPKLDSSTKQLSLVLALVAVLVNVDSVNDKGEALLFVNSLGTFQAVNKTIEPHFAVFCCVVLDIIYLFGILGCSVITAWVKGYVVIMKINWVWYVAPDSAKKLELDVSELKNLSRLPSSSACTTG